MRIFLSTAWHAIWHGRYKHGSPVLEFEQAHALDSRLGNVYKTPDGRPIGEWDQEFNEFGWRRRTFLFFDRPYDTLPTYFKKLSQGRVERPWSEIKYTRKILEQFIEKNIAEFPELKNLKYDRNSRHEVATVLGGILSGFNVDDINYYINDWQKYIHEHGFPDGDEIVEPLVYQEAVMDELKRRHGESLGRQQICWRPSPQTLDKICEALNIDIEPEIKARSRMCQSAGGDVINPGLGDAPDITQ